MISRRNLLGSILAMGAAPAIVRASSLMPIWVPPQRLITSSYFGGGEYIEYRGYLNEDAGIKYQEFTFEQPVTIRNGDTLTLTYKVLPSGLCVLRYPK